METRGEMQRYQQRAFIPGQKRCATQGLPRRYLSSYRPS